MTTAPVIAVDAMGGDRGPATVVAGLAKSARATPDARFLLFGPEATLGPLVARRPALAKACVVRDAPRAVGMADKPSAALRAAEGTSMWAALGALAAGEAQAAVSCGNTGALMAMAMLKLRKAPGVDRPAIAVLWPSRGAAGFTVALDVGADVRAEPEGLAQFAVMGAAYARLALGLERPRVGLLNVGAEETKGRPELRAALETVAAAAEAGGYAFEGFVEGGDLFGDRVDVIVTDGFAGNIALKAAEGAAAFIGAEMRRAFMRNWLTRIAGLIAMGVLSGLKRRIDPRRVNGGVFLGLGGAVVKSHGGADATGVAAAVALAGRMARDGFAQGVAAQVGRLAPAALAGGAAR
jgi:glycerol-3-phosphate acyltransferase PlsX